MPPHALARRQVVRHPDRPRAPPPGLCGADVLGDRHLCHDRPEAPGRGAARHPGHVLGLGYGHRRDDRVLLAHACPPEAPRPDVPIPAGVVRCPVDHRCRPHDRRRRQRSRQPVRHSRRSDRPADAPGQRRAGHAVRRARLRRGRVLGAPRHSLRRSLDPAWGLCVGRAGDGVRRRPSQRDGRRARSPRGGGAPGPARGG